MANIYDSDIQRITDAMERDEDWRLLIKSFPYELRDEVERRVISEHNERCAHRQFLEERYRFNKLPQKEKERLYIERGSAGYSNEAKILQEFEETLKASGNTSVLKARQKKEKKDKEAREKELREIEDEGLADRNAKFPFVAACYSLVLAVALYITYQIWFPSWGGLVGAPVVLKVMFSLCLPVPAIIAWSMMVTPRIEINRRSVRIYVVEALCTISAMYLAYDVWFHVIHTDFGCIVFWLGMTFAWVAFLMATTNSYSEDGDGFDCITSLLFKAPIFLWCAFYAYCICGPEQWWGAERDAWKEQTSHIQQSEE